MILNIVFAGYDALATDSNPHIFSSENWLAFEAGRELRRDARAKPHQAKIGRGYTVRVTNRFNALRVVFDIDDLKARPRVVEEQRR